jgi:mono/diheme cytochrome c family protein
MKKLSIITVIVLAITAWSCGDDVKRERSRNYMPDMYKSRAWETYANLDTLKAQGIHYTAIPVSGTIKRGELFPFPFAKDKTGDSVNYIASRQLPNPITALTPQQTKEAERLYLVNCGICHGTTLNGNGPLYKEGTGPYSAAPRNLVDDPVVSVMPEGQLFYSVTYGKNQMGPYASQLSTTQRWMVVKYVKDKQIAKKNGGSTKPSGDTTKNKTGPAVLAGSPATGVPATGDTTGNKK